MSCCKGCVAPKRTPYCHAERPEYIQESEERKKQKAEADAKKAVTSNLTAQVLAGVNKANKSRRRK